MLARLSRLSGMQKFTIIWAGETLSLFGTATTRFALLVWAYQQTGEATTTTLLGFFSFILYVLLSPIAGVVVDRFDRRLVMAFADAGSGIMTALLLLLFLTGGLQIWHLYIFEALSGAFEAFQLPAFSAATTMLVSKEHYSRASGMRSLAFSASQIIAPLLAGLILRFVGLQGVMIIDLISFGCGIVPLLFLRIPHPPPSTETKSEGNLWSNMFFGFRYIAERPGLLGLACVYVGINLAAALTYFAIMAPMVLARTGGDALALSSVQASMGVAGILGGLWMSTRGGPKRKIHGVLLLGGISFLFGDFLMAIGRTTPVWMFAAAFGTFFVPFISGCDRAIWQSKVPPDVQGRVFSVQSLLQEMTLPIGYLVAGPLADRLLEPAMQPGGSLAGVLGSLVGTGAGAGMAVMFLGTAVLGAVVCFGGYLFPAVRRVEIDLPDHNFEPANLSSEAVPEIA